jgi:hypothetical protein
MDIRSLIEDRIGRSGAGFTLLVVCLSVGDTLYGAVRDGLRGKSRFRIISRANDQWIEVDAALLADVAAGRLIPATGA